MPMLWLALTCHYHNSSQSCPVVCGTNINNKVIIIVQSNDTLLADTAFWKPLATEKLYLPFSKYEYLMTSILLITVYYN